MKQDFMDKDLELLSKIKPVEAPPFLLTRIQRKIKSEQSPLIAPVWYRLLQAAFVLLISLNIVAWVKHSKHAMPKNSLAQELNLVPDNSIYHE